MNKLNQIFKRCSEYCPLIEDYLCCHDCPEQIDCSDRCRIYNQLTKDQCPGHPFLDNETILEIKYGKHPKKTNNKISKTI